MSKLSDYITETRGELKHVRWPTRRQAVAFTAIVIVISIIVALYLGFLDYLFSQALEKIVL